MFAQTFAAVDVAAAAAVAAAVAAVAYSNNVTAVGATTANRCTTATCNNIANGKW